MKLCDPTTVSAFIQISSLVCPAEQYVFSIWGHGNGLSPMALPEGSLPMSGIRVRNLICMS